MTELSVTFSRPSVLGIKPIPDILCSVNEYFSGKRNNKRAFFSQPHVNLNKKKTFC